MKLVVVSDTHGMHRRMLHPIPDGDVLIHCGDMTGHGSDREVLSVAAWMKELPHRWKMAVGGNHDAALEGDNGYLRQAFADAGVLYMQDTAAEIEGVKFWGAPWTPNFCDWHFMPPRNSPELRLKWDLIPDDTQVLITHGPPHGILDAYVGEHYIAKAGAVHVGCELLAERTFQMPALKVHVFGHIHEGYGRALVEAASTYEAVNAAICNRDYRPVNAPQVVEV